MADWNNIPDEEFDDVFRKQTENHEELLWPDAWKKMSEKLDEKDKKRRFIIWWRYAAGLGVGLLIGFLTFNKVLRPDSLSKNSQNIPSIEKSDNGKTNKDLNKSEISNKPALSAVQKESFENKTAIDQPQKVDKQKKTKNTYSTHSQKPYLKTTKITDKKEDNLAVKTKIVETVKEDLENKKVLTEAIVQEPTLAVETDKRDADHQTQITNKQADETADPNKSENSDTKGQAPIEQVVKTNDQKESENPMVAEQKQSNINESENQIDEINTDNKKLAGISKFSFLIGASPDYSTVSFDEMQPMGYNIRLGLQYRLSKKLKIEAGIIRSLKLYDAYPENYTWPAKWGVPSSPLKEISASCSMLDIPIGLKYEFRQKKNSSLFAAMGITNYYMINEKYSYYYENDADPNLKWRKWEGSTGFAGAGVINVSVGLQKEISKNFKIQIEPFIKAPIRNIGFGNVRLFSSGIFLNIIPQNFFKKSNP